VISVAIDVTAAQSNRAGTKRYIDGLLSGLAELDTADITPVAAPAWCTAQASDRLRGKSATLYRDLWWPHVVLPQRVRSGGFDVLHMTANVGSIRRPCATVVTVFDTTVFEQGQHHKPWHRTVTRVGMTLAKQAAVILTISEYSKQRISAVLGVEPSKILVAYCGYDSRFRPLERAEREEATRLHYDLDEFILTVGTLEPRKNLGTLLKAYARLRREGYCGLLVHAGASGWKSADINRQIEDLGLRKYVRFLGHVDDATLVRVYNLASVFVYPSLMEGFGLPVLEAMACGTAVVSARGSSLEEVGGVAVRFVDPRDSDQLADQIAIVLEDSSLRETMVEAGFAQARRFSWRACAELTVGAYHQALKSMGVD
jgi:glycosyltransferase involved in cell wall biosynthesis